MTDDLHHYKCGIERKIQKTDIDPITTQIIRNSLNSAAEQMKKALCTTAMSPKIYEVMDFAFRKKEEYQFLNQKSVDFMSLCQIYILRHHLSRKADLVYF